MSYTFSPSSLSLLKDCPRCFWLKFRKGIKRPEGIFPSLPRGMDRVLKAHFESFRASGRLPPELAMLDGVTLFNDAALLKIWQNNFKGVQWKDADGNLLRGAVDELLQKDGKLIVLDYKTKGTPADEKTPGYYQNQLDIYNFLLRKNGYSTEDYAYLLVYSPTAVNGNGSVLFKTELVKVDINTENAERILATALNVLNGEEPDAKGECEFCGNGWGRGSQ